METTYTKVGSDENKIFEGLDEVAKLVQKTFGPYGQNVFIQNRSNGAPLITKDGVTVARSFSVKDKEKRLGAELVKSAGENTLRRVGDGTTSTILLVNLLCEIFREPEFAGVAIRKDLLGFSKSLVTQLGENAVPISAADIRSIAIVSSNNEESIVDIVVEAFEKASTVIVEKTLNEKDTIQLIEGFSFEKGFASLPFVNETKSLTYSAKEPLIVITKDPIVELNTYVPYLSEASNDNKGIVFICADITEEMEMTLLHNKINNNLNVCVIKNPAISNKDDFFDDLAAFCETDVLSVKDGVVATRAGVCGRILVENGKTTIVRKSGDLGGRLQTHLTVLAERTQNEVGKIEKSNLERRARALSEETAIISVGSPTENEVEVSERFDLFDDTVKSVKSAIKSGTVEGGLIGLFKAFNNVVGVGEFSVLHEGIQVAFANLLFALTKDSDLVAKVLEDPGFKGYNIKTKREVDMRAEGVLDSVKMLQVVVENAFTTAGLFLSAGGTVILDDD